MALIGGAPARRPNAAQLRITDLNLMPMRAALSGQPYRDEFSWPKIESIASSYRAQVARRETIIVDAGDSGREQPTLMRYDDADVICEGNHRASALWVSEVTDFELRLRVAEVAWPDYGNRDIRRRGQSFRSAN